MTDTSRRRCGLHFTSFDALGSWHHTYVVAWWEDENGNIYEHRVTFTLDADAAAELNRIDSTAQFPWKRGDESQRFPTRDDAIRAGAKFLREKLGDDIDIEDGKDFYHGNTLIVVPDDPPEKK